MRLALACLSCFALPTLADARPIVAGATLGLAQSKVDASDDASRTLGLFGRLGLTPRLSAQLELQQYRTEDDSYKTLRTWTAALVVDLTAHPRWVPVLLAGAGLDHESYVDGGDAGHGHHFEGGFGIEYRHPGGLTLGADARLGGRSMESDDVIFEGDGKAVPPTGPVFLVPSRLAEGEYRSLRLTLAIRF
jgi:hypothetical protein